MQHFIDWLITLSEQIPVSLFVVLGSVIEEIIAPIPSPFVMIIAGSIAAGQNQGLVFLVLLSLIGALSKTIASLVIYVVSDKAEDVILSKFGRFIGISSKDIEGIGKYLNKGKKDTLVLFLFRVIPLMPTAPVSAIAGMVKVKLKPYLIGTFSGLVVRNLIYLYFGYYSLGALESLAKDFDSLENIGYLILFVIVGGGFLSLYKKRKKGSLYSLAGELFSVGRNKPKKTK